MPLIHFFSVSLYICLCKFQKSFNNLQGRKGFKIACASVDGIVFGTQKSCWCTISSASQSIFR